MLGTFAWACFAWWVLWEVGPYVGPFAILGWLGLCAWVAVEVLEFVRGRWVDFDP